MKSRKHCQTHPMRPTLLQHQHQTKILQEKEAIDQHPCRDAKILNRALSN